MAETAPEPEPEPAPPMVVVDGPDVAVGGSDIEVIWTPTVEESDYINIVPVGTDAGVFGSYLPGKTSSKNLPPMANAFVKSPTMTTDVCWRRPTP